MKPRIAILGRPNVGKSSLFNRLVGRRTAIVDDTPGVTRDRKEGEARIGGIDVTVVDTAGLEESPPDTIPGRMRASSEAALREAVVDGLGIKPKFAFGPLRTAVSGQRISPPLFESMEILGKDS